MCRLRSDNAGASSVSYLALSSFIALAGVSSFAGLGDASRAAIAENTDASPIAVGQRALAAEDDSSTTASPDDGTLPGISDEELDRAERVGELTGRRLGGLVYLGPKEDSPAAKVEEPGFFESLAQKITGAASWFWDKSGLDARTRELFDGAFANTVDNWRARTLNPFAWAGGLLHDAVDFVWNRSGVGGFFERMTEHVFWRTRGQEADAGFWERAWDFVLDAGTAPATMTGNLLYDVLWTDVVGGIFYTGLSITVPDDDDRPWAVPIEASDELFIDGVSPQDIDQGALGDCIHLAGVAAIAQQNPELIEDMIVDNGDGTYTVTLHTERPPGFVWEPRWTTTEITVTAEVPVTSSGRSLYVRSPSGELWPYILEKALAEHRGGYMRMNGSLSSKFALEAITGQTTNASGYLIDNWVGTFGPSYTLPSMGDMSQMLDDGYAITASAKPSMFVNDAIPTGNHMYYVKAIDLENETIDIGNPWGERYDLTLTFEEFDQNFSGGTYARTR